MIDITNYAQDDDYMSTETLADIVFGGDVPTLDIGNALRAVALVAEYNMAHATVEYIAHSSRGYLVVLKAGGVEKYEARDRAYWRELQALANAMGTGRDVRLSNVRVYGKGA